MSQWGVTSCFTYTAPNLLISNTSGSTQYPQRQILTVGKWYKVSVTCSNVTGTIRFANQGGVITSTALIIGTTSAYILATDANLVWIAGNNSTATITGFTVQELSGNHAYQTVSASRPLLAYTPVSGVRNVATHSTNAADASWNFIGTRTSGVADSKGSLNAVRWSGVSTVPTKGCTVQKTGVHTVTMRLKVESASGSCVVLVRNNTKNTNYATGTLGGTTGIVLGAGWSAKAIGNGFWECTYTTPSLDAGDFIQAYFGATDTTVSTFAVVIEGLQVELGTSATPLQKTTTLLNVTEDGVESTYSLYFDGIDDFLQTNNIDFTATDEVSVFAGVRKLSDAKVALVCELSADLGLNNGTFYLAAPAVAGSGSITFNSKGTSFAPAGGPAFAPVSKVVAGSAKITEPRTSIRIDGVLKSSTGSAQGLGNYGNYPLYIGRRGGASLPFNGHLYSLIIMGRLASAEETSTIEKELAKRTGVTLSV